MNVSGRGSGDVVSCRRREIEALELNRIQGRVLFTYPEDPIHLHVPEHLDLSRGRPQDLDAAYRRRGSETNFLLQAGGAETPAGRNSGVDVPVCAAGLHGDLDAGANSGTVRRHPLEPESYPVIRLTRVHEERVARDIPGEGASHHNIDVLVAVVVDIADRDAVTFLKMSDPG